MFGARSDALHLRALCLEDAAESLAELLVPVDEAVAAPDPHSCICVEALRVCRGPSNSGLADGADTIAPAADVNEEQVEVHGPPAVSVRTDRKTAPVRSAVGQALRNCLDRIRGHSNSPITGVSVCTAA
jgi:hypothetical protein